MADNLESIEQMKARWLAQDIQTVAEERAFLAHNPAAQIRTLRLISFSTIRHAQRRIRDHADALIAIARAQGGAA